MIKRIVDISHQAAYVSVQDAQLVLRPLGDGEPLLGSVPCEDLGVMSVDHPGVTYSHRALVALVESGGCLLVCDSRHTPAGLLLPLSGNTEIVPRIHAQIEAARPVKKRLWKQIVRAKIRAQAANLPVTHPSRDRLESLADQVRSGDPANVEALAARIYWEAWRSDPAFRRNPDGDDIANAILNYGYAVLRAGVARALVSAGLHCALGIFHRNRSNAFCLADDLMEPMRPWVDRIAAQALAAGAARLDSAVKRQLLGLLHETALVGKESGPLMVGLHRMAASLVRCLEGSQTRLLIPQRAKGGNAPE